MSVKYRFPVKTSQFSAEPILHSNISVRALINHDNTHNEQKPTLFRFQYSTAFRKVWIPPVIVCLGLFIFSFPNTNA